MEKTLGGTSRQHSALSNTLVGEDIFDLFCHLISLPSLGLKPQMLQASWLDNQNFLSLPIIFPVGSVPIITAWWKCAFSVAPHCLWTISKGVRSPSIKKEKSGKVQMGWKSESDGFLPNCVCMLTITVGTLQRWSLQRCPSAGGVFAKTPDTCQDSSSKWSQKRVACFLLRSHPR